MPLFVGRDAGALQDPVPARRRALLVVLLATVLAACSTGGAGNRHATGPAASPTTLDAPATSRAPTTPTTLTTPTTAPSGPQSGWTTYQAGPARLGVAAGGQPPLAPLRPAWDATLDGAAVYAQPLLAGGRVIVATEDDDVYALDPHDGSVVWRVNIGAPLHNVARSVGCGNVDPLGITSTPVADPSTGLVYAVGEVSTAGAPPVHHQMVAIDIRSGRVVRTAGADPPLPAGENPLHLLQRPGLALGNGRVYIGFGGHYGDCGKYHGWLVSLPAAGPAGPATPEAAAAFDVTPAGTGGAIWGSGAAPAIAEGGGGGGSVYVTTGNPNGSSGPTPWAEAVLELAPGLGPAPQAVFRDRAATGDLDLATGGPVLLPDGEAFVVGKTDIGYRLRASDLSELATVRGTVCASDPDGGAAYDAELDALYVPCRDGGIQQIDLGRDTVGWRSGSANSTPILAGGGLWALAYPTGIIQEIDPRTGQVLFSTRVGRTVPNFASPSAADGLLLVPTTSGITAYSGPSGPPPSAPGPASPPSAASAAPQPAG